MEFHLNLELESKPNSREEKKCFTCGDFNITAELGSINVPKERGKHSVMMKVTQVN